AADRNEWPSGVFFAPQGSLVEWLDGFMKTPSTDEDRVFGKYENAISALHMFPESVRPRVFYKSFPYRNGFGNHGVPYRHADLAMQPFWRCEVWMPSANVSACADSSRSPHRRRPEGEVVFRTLPDSTRRW
ncbi:MAG TPA: hypothetical protein VH539_09300, partial [Gemmatimonadaceae bacterium]